MTKHEVNEHPRETVTNGAKGATTPARGRDAGVVRFGAHLPGKLRSAMEKNPVTVVASIAGGAFLLGAILASSLGRTVAVAAIGYGVNRFLEGPMGVDMEAFARRLANSVET